MSRNKFKVVLCLILTFGQLGYGLDIAFTDVADVLRLGREMVMDVLESYEIIRPKGPGEEENTLPFIKRMEKELRNRIAEVSAKIDVHQQKMEIRFEEAVSRILTDLPMKQRLDSGLQQFDQHVNQINDLYDVFERYSQSPKHYERYTMEDFARTCVSSRRNALPDVLKTLHRLIVPGQDQLFNNSLIVLLANQMREASSQICNEFQSSQQLLYNLYTTVTLAEIKGYAMIQFSYFFLRMYNQGSNFSEEMELAKQQYATRTSETLRAVKTAMAFAPRDLWRCDPRVHKPDETYTEMKQLFQGYIINEVDLNPESTCRETCGYYGYAKVYGCYQNQFCSQQRKCNGKLVNCEYVDSDMWICPSNRNSARRYEYIQYESGRVFGQKDTCQRGTTKVDSWWRWLFWHCSYCFCYCDDNTSNSDRYFSLRESVSDVADNRVVTGIRLKKVNHIIHMQIQQGELLPLGAINETNNKWKEVDEFSILDRNVTSGVDYHTLAWEKRALDLDDLVADQDRLLTGIRFRMVGSRLNLEIRMTPFNFTTGKLIEPLGRSFWHSNDVTDRTELELKNPDVPVRSILPTLPDNKVNQYLNFAPSDRDKDAAQSTVPFLDIQPIEPNPPIPIAGAGIFHKGRKGSGGFVALKLITYNFAPHLQADPTPPVIDSPNEIRAV